MSLSDIMGHLALDVYAQVGIVLFLSAFVAVAVNALARRRDETRALAAMPLLDDDAPPAPHADPAGASSPAQPSAPASTRTPRRRTP